jgi:predicted ATPase
MHIKRLSIRSDKFPGQDQYPFNLPVFQDTRTISFDSPITFFIGENGSGKSTLLEAIAQRCGIHIWRNEDGASTYCKITGQMLSNTFLRELFSYIQIEWTNGQVPGSYFSAEIFHDFTHFLEGWANANKDHRLFDYFGGKSLVSQSHGQGIMGFFGSRYKIKGLYLLDEPEAALSPKTQIVLLNLLRKTAERGHAQFIIASHSPILLACPGATLYSFDRIPIAPVAYEETDYYRIYKEFLNNRLAFIKGSNG